MKATHIAKSTGNVKALWTTLKCLCTADQVTNSNTQRLCSSTNVICWKVHAFSSENHGSCNKTQWQCVCFVYSFSGRLFHTIQTDNVAGVQSNESSAGWFVSAELKAGSSGTRSGNKSLVCGCCVRGSEVLIADI